MIECFCDYDAPAFYDAKLRKARKHYRCDECHRAILAGEQYERVSGKWDGSLSTFITCISCLDLRTWLTNSLPCFCWAHGNMISDAKDAIDDAYSRSPEEARGLWFGFLRRRSRREARA